MNKLTMDQHKRLEDIGSVLVKHGFEKVVSEIITITARLRRERVCDWGGDYFHADEVQLDHRGVS